MSYAQKAQLLKLKQGLVFVMHYWLTMLKLNMLVMSNACTTCHIYVREGFDDIEESDETENDLLDKAWGLDPDSRLSCQAIVSDTDLVIEIPKYTINQVSENH